MAVERTARQGYLFEPGVAAEPALVSPCLLGIPCRWHGRRAKKREKLIGRLKEKYVLVPVRPDQPSASRAAHA